MLNPLNNEQLSIVEKACINDYTMYKTLERLKTFAKLRDKYENAEELEELINSLVEYIIPPEKQKFVCVKTIEFLTEFFRQYARMVYTNLLFTDSFGFNPLMKPKNLFEFPDVSSIDEVLTW